MLMAQEDYEEHFQTEQPQVRAKIVWHRRPAVQRRLRLVTRLLSMGPAELTHRAWRVMRKHAKLVEAPQREAGHDWPEALYADPATYLFHRTTVCGFFDLESRAETAASARKHLPQLVEFTTSEANAIIEDGIELLGQRFRPMDADFDWHADPLQGRLWPLTKLDDNDAVRGVQADVKFVWEVNRQQYLVTLARAYAYTGDERYARACIELVLRWVDANPVGVGVNWASNLEVAMRTLSWVWSLHFLVGAASIAPVDLRRWLSSLRTHRDHLERNLSVYTDPTNHLIGEAAALAVICLWLPEWPDSEEFRSTAIEILEREILHQVEPDGFSKEQATSYQRFVLDLVLQVIVLADRNNCSFDDRSRLRVRSMLEAAEAMAGTGRRVPRIGDSDDARGIPFFTSDRWSFEDLLTTGATVLPSAELDRQRSADCESAFWLRGGPSSPAPSPATIEGKRQHGSRIFESGGYAILESSGSVASRLVFDCGPLGYLPHASHGHADLLSVLVDVDGAEMLIDPGSFAYYDERGLRDVFRSTRAHNTIEIGGLSQADPFDPFKWLNIPRQGIQRHDLGGGIDYVEAWHDGYKRLVPGVRHRRAVVGLRGAWLVVDWLEGSGRQGWTRWFHGAVDTTIERIDTAAARLRSDSRSCALLVRDLSANGQTGGPGLATGTSPYSESYASLNQAPTLRFVDKATSLPAVRLTLLVPETSGVPSASVKVAAIDEAADGSHIWLELECEKGGCLEIAVRGPGAPSKVGRASTDARFALRARTPAGETFTFNSNGQHVEFNDA